MHSDRYAVSLKNTRSVPVTLHWMRKSFARRETHLSLRRMTC